MLTFPETGAFLQLTATSQVAQLGSRSTALLAVVMVYVAAEVAVVVAANPCRYKTKQAGRDRPATNKSQTPFLCRTQPILKWHFLDA